jgi:hypothetical protein
MGEPPLEDWSRAEALREVLRVARGLDGEDFERDVLPRLRRLTPDQRRQVLEGHAGHHRGGEAVWRLEAASPRPSVRPIEQAVAY